MKSLSTAVNYVLHGEFAKLTAGLRERTPAWALHRGTAYIFELNNTSGTPGSLQPPNLPDDHTFRELTREELTAVATFTHVPLGELRRRHEHGEGCFGIFWGTQPVHVIWLHGGACYVRGLGLQLQLDAADCYLYGVVTASNHRGQGLYTTAQREVIRLLAMRGVRRIVQVVEHGNEIPLAALPKLGYKICHVVRHITMCGLKRTLILDTDGKLVGRQFHWRNPGGVFRI